MDKDPVEFFHWLSDNEFAKIPEIAKWMNECIARELSPNTIYHYFSTVRYMFNLIKVEVKDVLSSKEAALDFWTKFRVEYRKKHPQNGTHAFRVSYRNLLSSHDIFLNFGMAKLHGLSSAHDDLGAHAGVSFTPEVTKEIGNLILRDGDFMTYVYFRVALRTGARNKAISRMTWDRVHFNEVNEDGSESFRLEQHETKVPKGHWFLGENGEWKTKFPPLEIKKLLLEWKLKSGYTKFVWFPDGKSDLQNRRNAKKVREVIEAKLQHYYKKISDKVDPHTREYMHKRPVHILRHTFAQQLKNSGFANDEISEMGGWGNSQTVGTWYTKMPDEKRRELGKRGSKVSF